jgi:hypothetical protein
MVVASVVTIVFKFQHILTSQKNFGGGQWQNNRHAVKKDNWNGLFKNSKGPLKIQGITYVLIFIIVRQILSGNIVPLVRNCQFLLLI